MAEISNEKRTLLESNQNMKKGPVFMKFSGNFFLQIFEIGSVYNIDTP